MSEAAETREALLSGEKGDPIAHMLAGLRHGEVPAAGPLKQRVYALSAYLLECMVPVPYQLLDKNFLLVQMYATFEGRTSAGVYEQMIKLGDLYPQLFLQAFEELVTHVNLEKESPEAKAFEHLHELLEGEAMGSGRGANPEDFLVRGANTAARVSWNLLRGLPFAFYARYGRIPTDEEFLQLAQDAEPQVIWLASMHLENFGLLFTMLRGLTEEGKLDPNASFQPSDTSKNLLLEFPLELFKIVDVDGKPALVFDPETIAAFKKKLEERGNISEQLRYGCPARDARVEERGHMVSLVSSIYQAHIELAKTHLLPRMQTYVDGGLEIATRSTNRQAPSL